MILKKNNPLTLRTVYNEHNEIIYKSSNNSNNKAYHAIKPDKDKFIQLKQLLKQFTHKELTEYILNNVTNHQS